MADNSYNKLKVLIYGHRGWIGQQFVQLCNQFHVKYVLGSSRCNDFKSVCQELQEQKSKGLTHVISFIGRTHGVSNGQTFNTIDYLEQNGKLQENVRDNLYSPLILAHVCKSLTLHYTYLGTGCIFTYDGDRHLVGQERNGFTEKSKPNFFGSSYSIMKGYTDTMMQDLFSSTVLNLRIRMPITGTVNPRNFITKITRYEKICNMPNSMSVLPDLLPIIFDLMLNQVVGTLNFTNPGLISHNEILTLYREIVDPDFTWTNFTVEEQNKVLLSERSNNYLDTTRLQILHPYILPIKESVRRVLREYQRNLRSISPTPPLLLLESTSKIVPPLPFPPLPEAQSKTYMLVTGGCGFIGSNFINYMFNVHKNVHFINLDALYYSGNYNNVAQHIRESSRYTFIQGNLQSFDLLRHIFQTYSISEVVHFAAQSHVDNSFEDSINYTKDNILGTHVLLEVNRLYNPHLHRFIHISTDEVYGESIIDSRASKKSECCILAPTNPYAATKAGAELIAQSYIHSYNMPIIITRGNNVYGPNQYPEKVIPKFIDQLLKGQKITIQGKGDSLRTFLHAEDTARAIDIVLRKGVCGDIYNIGGLDSMEFTVLQVGKLLIDLIKNPNRNLKTQECDYDSYIQFVPDRPFNDKRYYINSDKLNKLGWTILHTDFRQDLLQLIRDAKKLV